MIAPTWLRTNAPIVTPSIAVRTLAATGPEHEHERVGARQRDVDVPCSEYRETGSERQGHAHDGEQVRR